MSLPPPEFRTLAATLRITAWEDPVVDLLGHDARSPYVEEFWLSVLGPSTTFFLRHVAGRLEESPGGFDLDLEETAKALGLGVRAGTGSPFVRAIARTGQFRLSQPVSSEALMVRRRLPPLTRHQLARLPAGLRDRHDAWEQQARQEPTIEQRRTRARRLALSLLELGETDEATEVQLHRWKIHPALAHEALRWAQARRREAPADEIHGTPPAGPAATVPPGGASADGGPLVPSSPASRPLVPPPGSSPPAPPRRTPAVLSAAADGDGAPPRLPGPTRPGASPRRRRPAPFDPFDPTGDAA